MTGWRGPEIGPLGALWGPLGPFGRTAAAMLRLTAAAAGTLIGAAALLALLIELTPGDTLDALPDGVAADFGMASTPLARWTGMVGRLARLDLGTSYVYRPGAPVVDVLAVPAGQTLGLVLAGAAVLMGTALALAFLTAGRPRNAFRGLIQGAGIAPGFLLAFLLVVAINELTWSAMQAGSIVRPSWFALPDQPSPVRSAVALFALVVGSGTLANAHAELEDALVKIRSSPWVDAVRARGGRTWPAVLRAMVPPFAATLAQQAGLLVGSAVIIENVLLVNGLGRVLWRAAEARDLPLAFGAALGCAALVAMARLLAEGLRLVADPRLREVA